MYNNGLIDKEHLESFLQGWKGYSNFANTHNFNKRLINLPLLS